jgi:RimJ/RimL family protein N-acetyltransferase
MPSFPSLDAPLSDGLVALRPSAERDIPEILIAYQDDRRLHQALGESRPPTGAALGSRAERASEELRAGRRLTLTILQAGSDVCRGEIRIADVDWDSRRAELRVWVAPDRRGQGLARRARGLATSWLSRECGLEAVCPGEG